MLPRQGWRLCWWRRGSSAAYRAALGMVVGIVLVASTLAGAAPNFQIIDVPAGSSQDVYFEINLKGTVYLHVVADDGGEACAEFWWIKWPLGNIQSLGRHCGSASFPIPGLFDFAISAKLRVGGAAKHLKIVASDQVSVANSVSVTFP